MLADRLTDPTEGFIPYQVCPKCNGLGEITQEYNIVEGFVTSTYTMPLTCPVCQGAKVIPMYKIQDNNKHDSAQ